MARICVPTMFAMLFGAASAAFDVPAKIRHVDRDANALAFLAAGQERSAQIAADARVFGADGKELAEGIQSALLAEGADAVLSIERVGAKPVVQAIRLGAGAATPLKAALSAPNAPSSDALPPLDTSALVALTDFGPDEEYLGARGGLYPDNSNERPAAHTEAGLSLAEKIQPLDAEGNPSASGRIVLLAIGFSNTSQVFAGFMQAAADSSGLNPRLTLVNGAQGGRSAFMIKNPDDGSIGSAYWKEWVPGRLAAAAATAAQVQAIWLKQTDAALGPAILAQMGVAEYDLPLRMPFPRGAQTLQRELETIVQAMPRFFPNLRMVYVSSRSYGGWASREGNREPWSYETGFAVKWLIEKQLQGDPSLNFDPAKGKVEAPWLSWGPYLWANGDRPRKDGFAFDVSDYSDKDHMHYSPRGQIKVGRIMVDFFKNDPTSKIWFAGSE